jgi:hypothetical protein
VKQAELRWNECAEAVQSDQSTQLSSSGQESAAASWCTSCKLVCALTMLDFEFCAQEESSACAAPCCSSFAAGRCRYAAVPERSSVCCEVCVCVLVLCEGVIFVAQAKTQRSTSPGTHFKRSSNGSCNELLEPEVVTPAALMLVAVGSQELMQQLPICDPRELVCCARTRYRECASLHSVQCCSLDRAALQLAQAVLRHKQRDKLCLAQSDRVKLTAAAAQAQLPSSLSGIQQHTAAVVAPISSCGVETEQYNSDVDTTAFEVQIALSRCC